MNKNIKRIIATALMCASFSGMAAFEAAAAPKYVNITGDPVAVREAPGTSAKFIKQVRYGDQMVYLSEKNDKDGVRWYQIKLSDDKSGWVTSAYAETVDEEKVGRLEVTTKLLNVRSEASLTGAVLGITKIGTQFDYFSVKKDSSDQTWYFVHYEDDKTAWLLGTYCKVISEPGKADSTTTTKATSDNKNKQVEITANPVNVRSKASLSGSKLGTVSKGKRYEYLATDTDEKGQVWYKIRYTSEKTGWVLGSLSRIVNSGSTTESEKTSKTESTTTQAAESKQVEITADALNVRSTPGMNGKIITTVKNGSKYNYLASKKDSEGKTWYQIEYKSGKKGWISAGYAKIINKGATTASTTTTTATKATTSGKKVRITGGRVNVRSSAGLNGKKLGSVKKGEEYKYLATKKDSNGDVWYQIQYTSKTKGWVLGSLSKLVTEETKATTTTTAAEKTETKKVEITESPVNVRKSASTDSKKLGTTSEGKKYKLLSTKKDKNGKTWYQIQYTSKTKGWVLGTFCKLV
jgi:N-acetylmuramoyl-L-alanine amidase